MLENIRYGKVSATLKQVHEAATKAQIHDYIMQLPDQYHTLAGEDGAALSGGERQRVAIARAILQDAPILILDEATSALDTETEQKIQATMEQFFKNRQKTMIIIAHRLSTVRNADRIVVLDKGQIIEEGTHEKLLAKKGAYATLWQAQYIP